MFARYGFVAASGVHCWTTGMSSVLVGLPALSKSSLPHLTLQLHKNQLRFATKIAGGISRNGRDSRSKRLGVKKFGGEIVKTGQIIIRQRGQKYRPGFFCGMGRDHTLFALKDGFVKFRYDKIRKQQVVNVTEHHPHYMFVYKQNWMSAGV